MIKRLKAFFANPYRLAILNALVILLTVAANLYFQAFCIPVAWATIVIITCFINTIVYPIIFDKYPRLIPFSGFVNGVSFMMYVYCTLFLAHINLLALFLIIIGLGLIAFVPHFLAVQLLLRNFINPVSAVCKRWFVTGIAVSLLTAFTAAYLYHRAILAVDKLILSNYTMFEKGYMNERVLGMHFIYHTRYDEYDGWRPPLHDPLMIVGMWFNWRKDPLIIPLERRIALYKRIYPEKPIKLKCSCATEYSDMYHNDPRLK